ncbi:MAG TPA: hypothetical protein EYP40_05290 [Chromatiales bacterium]|nr:hypothetical protein [Chromatiales bacterium]
MLKRLWFIALPVLVSCQAIREANQKADLAYFPPVGSVWVLEKKLVAPGRSMNLLIIDGKVHDSYFLWNRYKPACSLDFMNPNRDETTIRPTRFVITKVERNTETIDTTTGNSMTIMHVTSADNARIKSITCQGWNSYDPEPYVSIAEMREATRGILRLEIKGQSEAGQNKGMSD